MVGIRKVKNVEVKTAISKRNMERKKREVS
jgi:hypothetical protein